VPGQGCQEEVHSIAKQKQPPLCVGYRMYNVHSCTQKILPLLAMQRVHLLRRWSRADGSHALGKEQAKGVDVPLAALGLACIQSGLAAIRRGLVLSLPSFTTRTKLPA